MYFSDTLLLRGVCSGSEFLILTARGLQPTLAALLKQRQPGVEARIWSYDQKMHIYAALLSSSGVPMGGQARGALCSPMLHRSSNPRFGRPPDWKRVGSNYRSSP